MRYPLRQFVTAILVGDYQAVALDPPRRSPEELRSMARRYLALAARPVFADPRHIAVARGVDLIPRAPRGLCGEGTVPGTIAYDGAAEPRLRGLYVGHGLSHLILSPQPDESNESDAWWLTSYLLVPPSERDRRGWNEMEQLAHAPQWFTRTALTEFDMRESVGF